MMSYQKEKYTVFSGSAISEGRAKISVNICIHQNTLLGDLDSSKENISSEDRDFFLDLAKTYENAGNYDGAKNCTDKANGLR